MKKVSVAKNVAIGAATAALGAVANNGNSVPLPSMYAVKAPAHATQAEISRKIKKVQTPQNSKQL